MHEAILLTQFGDLNITRPGKEVSRLTFNFPSGHLAALLLGMFGDAKLRSVFVER
jgi:membrane-associated phospholipid phosphatase